MSPATDRDRSPADPLAVGCLCTRILTVVRRETPLVDAARRMREEHVGCVVVAEPTPTGDVAVGILTDRDIVVSVVALGIDPAALAVSDVMTAAVSSVPEGGSIGTVLALMRDQGIRRVPVTSADGVLVGLLTFDDLVAALTLQTQAMTEALVVGRQREGDVHP
ncbi:MAG TPA: CBS domain-containing protein [Burkholderiaceae bacterium]